MPLTCNPVVPRDAIDSCLSRSMDSRGFMPAESFGALFHYCRSPWVESASYPDPGCRRIGIRPRFFCIGTDAYAPDWSEEGKVFCGRALVRHVNPRHDRRRAQVNVHAARTDFGCHGTSSGRHSSFGHRFMTLAIDVLYRGLGCRWHLHFRSARFVWHMLFGCSAAKRRKCSVCGERAALRINSLADRLDRSGAALHRCVGLALALVVGEGSKGTRIRDWCGLVWFRDSVDSQCGLRALPAGAPFPQGT